MLTSLGESDGPVIFRGCAVPYNETSRMLYDRARPYRERFVSGALQWSEDTVMLVQHDQRGVPLGRVAAGTLKFEETAEGLMFRCNLPESRMDIREALERGDLDGSVSIGFQCEDDDWMHTKSASLRTVRKARLAEVSVVTAGAYRGARGYMKES